MDEAERRQVLEAIARDPDTYPRDRIAAIKALEEMRYGEQSSSASWDEFDRRFPGLHAKRST
jgi:hypothetical protein